MRCYRFAGLLITNGIFLFSGLVLLIAFPNWIIQRIAAKLMYLQQDYTGKSNFLTDYWERLPAVHYFKFYAFNITNYKDVMFYGHEPVLEETGPYTYAMMERKENIHFLDDGNLVAFRNNKTWVYDQQRSCATCKSSDKVAFPNLVFTTMMYYKRSSVKSRFFKFVLDVFIVIMRIQPIKLVSISEILLDSYKDPTVELLHTEAFKTFKKIFKLNTPFFGDLGYFPKYNKTSDGDYVIRTGKDDIKNIGQIVKWENMTELPWWNTPETRTLRGSGDGINQKPGIGKMDKYEYFQPLMCRKFNFSYTGLEGHIHGIPTLGFSFDRDSYDGVSNVGYRYENLERANYFPGWPCGLNHTVEITERCKNISCDKFENWCDKCCNGSLINGTYVLPPGFFPLRCQPARNIVLPLGVFMSTPHFLWSPKQVQTSLKGLNPDPTLHHPGIFHLNPFTGHTVGANFKVQFNVPLYPNNGLVWNKVPTNIIPTVWVHVKVEVLDYALDSFYILVVVSQRAVFIASIILLALSGALTTFLMFKVISERARSRVGTPKQETSSWDSED